MGISLNNLVDCVTRSKETNYEHFFGTPETTALMRIEREHDDENLLDGVCVWCGDDLVAVLWNQQGMTFEQWLKTEYWLNRDDR